MTAKLTREAMRAARALLGLTMQELAPKIGVSPTTLNAVEKGDVIRASTTAKIIEGLERLGVEITNGEGTGARLLFQYAYACERTDGTWGVFGKWREGESGGIVTVETAMQIAAEAEARGESRIASAFRTAANDAAKRPSGT